MIPGSARMARMPYWRFAIANVTGGAFWGAAMVLAGYLAGNSWHTVKHSISVVGIGVTLGLIAMLVIARAIRRRRALAGDDTSPAGASTVGDADGDDAPARAVDASSSTLASEVAQPAPPRRPRLPAVPV